MSEPEDVRNLKGAALRKAVAESLGWRVFRDVAGDTQGAWICTDTTGMPHSFTKFGFAPDLKWEQGGPIIERERIEWIYDENDGTWMAAICGVEHPCCAKTPLEASMRAFVLMKRRP